MSVKSWLALGLVFVAMNSTQVRAEYQAPIPSNAVYAHVGVSLKGRIWNWNVQGKNECLQRLLGNRRFEAEKLCNQSAGRNHNYAQVTNVKAQYSFWHKQCSITFDVNCLQCQVPWIERGIEDDMFRHQSLFAH